jgi:secreted trypsin-like serine protease
MTGRLKRKLSNMDRHNIALPRRGRRPVKRSSVLFSFALTFSSLVLCTQTALSQTPKDEETCFNANREQVLMMAGGRDASLADWPFIGALRQRRDFNAEEPICTGSFLSSNWFLTAAHCVTIREGAFSPQTDTGLPRFSVSQSPDQRSRDVDKTAVAVKKIVIAPGFARGSGESAGYAEHDIALLKLATPFKFAVKDVYFPIPATARFEKSWIWPNRCVSVAGWGHTEVKMTGAVPEITEAKRLQEMNVMIWDDAECAQSAFWPKKATHHFCAGYRSLAKNACKGDSGGPVVMRDSPTGFSLVGVLSSGPPVCPGNKPNLYTRVSAHYDWIDQTMKQDPN